MRQGSLIGYLLLSGIAAAMLLVVSWMGPLIDRPLTFEDRSIIALAFIGSCVLGIVLSLGPRRLHSLRKKAKNDDAESIGSQTWIGHHPDCSRFEDHVIEIKKKKYCAGCIGLALGSLISLIIMASYLLLPPVGVPVGQWLVVIGLFVILVCMAEVAWHLAPPIVHVLSNAAMVIGFLLVIVGTASSSEDVVFSLFAVLICFLWLDTRIQISDWKHVSTCRICGRSCRAY
ncbi:MAG: hypothetical protein LUO85_02080 [Methanomassiliicoccales archaeon]|nr:hypothetical protein [Methanomassiliicoccales archaeon]